ncbi:glycosyltransferase [Thermobrachium celere]|uniref:glycosyltransferase n=1 Tax=Thermobrachium celere TaxID=53422 RepID=UPI0019404F5C|nr:glycosyltransferase [Thermobrachium celere]GFR36226.1 glycosyl transferase [Thermobrachium celere]
MKKKIIIVNNNLKIGGIQKSLINLLNEIKNNYDITLLLFSDEGEYISYVPKEVKIKTASKIMQIIALDKYEVRKKGIIYTIIRTLFLLYTKLFNSYLPIKIITKLNKKIIGYDCAISFLNSAGPKKFYGGCNEFVLDVINADKKITFIHCDFIKAGVSTAYTKRLYSKFDIIVACSEGCRRSFIQAMPELKHKTKTVLNCINYDEVKELSNEEPIIYDKNFFNIITVARLSKEKGIDRAVAAVKECLDLGYFIKYHIIGDGPEKESLEKLTSDLGIGEHVIFYGKQINPYRFMKNADLFLLPSYHEAAPLVVEEAKCIGLPILSTETTSSKEMIIDANAGWVCENSLEGLKKYILHILDNKNELVQVKNHLLNKSFNNNLAVEQFDKIIN